MIITLKYIEVRYASYEQGIPEHGWALAPDRDFSKTIRRIIDETIAEVQEGEYKNAEFDNAFRFWYEAGGRDIHIDYDDGNINLCFRDPEERVLAEDEYADEALYRTLDETFQSHQHIIEQYANHPAPKKKA